MKIDLTNLYNRIKDTRDEVIVLGNKKLIDEFVKDNELELNEYIHLDMHDSLYNFISYNDKTLFVIANGKYDELKILICGLLEPIPYKVNDIIHYDKPSRIITLYYIHII